MTVTFFSANERKALSAIADYILPPDAEPGGAALGAVEYIERLMTALEGPGTPRIHASGPYSGRQPYPASDGTASNQLPSNDFASYLPLDRVTEALWRLRLYGSAGVQGGGPNDAITGPVTGLRDLVKSGLQKAMSSAPGPIESLTADQMKTLFAGLDMDFKNNVATLVMEAAFAAPEYGGNKNLAGWRLAHFEGDSAPFGYTQYNPTTQTYRERPDAPFSTPNPDPDPAPLSDESLRIVTAIVGGLDGRKFS
jgi:hypothetical protein